MATQLFQPPHGSPAWFQGMVSAAANSESVITERCMLTPTLAAHLLGDNPDNRQIRPQKLAQLASDIRSGRWVFNGEPLLISANGLLNDGQHRCTAVIETNLAIEVLIVFGLDRASRVTVDQGVARAAADYLTMGSVGNATLVASVGRLLIAYERSEGKNINSTALVTNGEILARFSDDENMVKSATFAGTMHTHAKKLAPPSIIGTCHYLMSRVNAAKTEEYLRQVCVGENIRKSDPAFAVREGLFRDRLKRVEKMHIIFRGWNAVRQGRKLDLAKVIGNLPGLM
jgi:hypothetical protein